MEEKLQKEIEKKRLIEMQKIEDEKQRRIKELK